MIMEKIAVIGISGIYPDADTPEKMFENLLAGKNSVRFLTRRELKKSGIEDSVLAEENYKNYGTTINNYKNFDYKFFDMTPFEAKLTDPQQRIFLQCAFQALQDAGYDPFDVQEKMGVFGSESSALYLQKNIIFSKYYNPERYDYPIVLGNDPDSLSTRVSYKFNLQGPSLTVQSGCSSSLVALNYAIQSIISGECYSSLVGGVSLRLPQPAGYFYSEGSTFSKTGIISPFSKEADGMVVSSGCSMVVVKKLDDAIKDHNYIYGVIEGIGVNNDGNQKVGYTAPSVKGQVGAINIALKKAGISSSDIDYIEMHGTGTSIGDPIEFRSIVRGYGKSVGKKVYLGSIKANIGHLDAAAGLTGMVKDLLILKNRIIPKQINFTSSNENINLTENGFDICTCNEKLNSGKHYVAFTSLGIGGTNVHGILSSYQNEQTANIKSEFLIPVSGQNQKYLNQELLLLASYLKRNTGISITDIGYTMFRRLSRQPFRTYFVVENINELLESVTKYIMEENDKNRKINELGEEWIKNGRKSVLVSQIPEGNIIPLPSIRFLGEELWVESESKKQPLTLNVSEVSNRGTDTLSKILNIWAENIGRYVEPDEVFSEIGGESLTAVMIIGQINTELSLHLNPSLLQTYDTPNKMNDYISEIVEEKNKEDNVVLLNKGTKNISMFLIHPAGGSIFCYEKLLRGIDTSISIYGISYPENISPQNSIDKLAKIYANQIKKVISDKQNKIILGGYSFGGNESLSVMKELNDMGYKVSKIVMIDSIVPEAYSEAKLAKQDYINKFPEIWQFIMGAASSGDLQLKEKFDNINQAIRYSRKQHQIPDTISDEMVERLFSIWTANHKVLSEQVLPTDLDVEITLFYATEKLSYDLYSFTYMKPYEADEWRKYSKRLKVIYVDGNHYSMFGEQEKLKKLQKQFQEVLHNYEKIEY